MTKFRMTESLKNKFKEVNDKMTKRKINMKIILDNTGNIVIVRKSDNVKFVNLWLAEQWTSKEIWSKLDLIELGIDLATQKRYK